MGYNAKYSGTITFSRDAYAKNREWIEGCLSEQFEIYDTDSTDLKPNITTLFVSGSDKYREEAIKEVFGELLPLGLDNACIEFVGEDEALWKIVVSDGVFNEYAGNVVYEDHPLQAVPLVDSGRKA